MIQWYINYANGTYNFVIPFTYVCGAIGPRQSGYAVGLSYTQSGSSYTQFKINSNYTSNKADAIFIGY